MAQQRHEVIFSPQAEDSLRSIVQDVQEVSLLSAEKLRKKILHKMHLIQHQPHSGSKRVTSIHSTDIRCATVMHYKIFYALRDMKVLVLELLAEKMEKPV